MNKLDREARARILHLHQKSVYTKSQWQTSAVGHLDFA
jgi:hypothetical protein